MEQQYFEPRETEGERVMKTIAGAVLGVFAILVVTVGILAWTLASMTEFVTDALK